MEENKSVRSFVWEIFIGVVVAVISTIIIAKLNGCFAPSSISKEERNKKVFSTLYNYSEDLNNNTFDAYKYFTPRVERFFQMLDTSPKKINDYVNGLFRKQFKNARSHFDENTLCVKEIDGNEYEAEVIMYSTYYNVHKKKQYANYRTKLLVRFDNNFRIKYFRQYFD
jgi:hypothetical protein